MIPRLDEKSLLHEPGEYRLTQHGVGMPEPRRLHDSQRQPWHLEKLRPGAPKRDSETIVGQYVLHLLGLDVLGSRALRTLTNRKCHCLTR
jgi:hypothetical protein